MIIISKEQQQRLANIRNQIEKELVTRYAEDHQAVQSGSRGCG